MKNVTKITEINSKVFCDEFVNFYPRKINTFNNNYFSFFRCYKIYVFLLIIAYNNEIPKTNLLLPFSLTRF